MEDLGSCLMPLLEAEARCDARLVLGLHFLGLAALDRSVVFYVQLHVAIIKIN